MNQIHDMGGVLLRWARRGVFWAALLLTTTLWGQADGELGIISGTVTESGLDKPLAEVTVTLRGFTLATTTDALGRFTLRLVPPGDHVLIFSRPGYTRAVVENIRVAPGQTSKADYAMKPQYYDLDPFDVIAEPVEEQSVNLLQERQDSLVMQDSIGSEFLSRVGAGDAAEAVAKVTGVTITDGKFAVIRGLSDRYTSATLNGGEIPSADPYRKSAQLDLFPSGMIDEIVVSKTFTPDQPGGFTGGSVNIITKSFPERFTFSMSAGTAYNNQGSLNDEFLTYQGGSTDWLAMDDGTRALPDILQTTDPVVNVNSGSAAARLAKANLLEAQLRSFKTPEFGPSMTTSPMDHDFAFSFGDTLTNVLGRPLGFFAGMSYSREFQSYDDGTFSRSVPLSSTDPVPTTFLEYEDARSVEEIAWGAVANVAYRLLEGHDISFNFLFSQTADDTARVRVGRDQRLNQFDPGNVDLTYLNTLYWVERNLTAYQMRGDHEFKGLAGLQLDWLASLAGTTQDEPDFRVMNLIFSPDPADPTGQTGFITVGDRSLPEPNQPTRYFRSLDDQNNTFKVDLTLPVELWSGLQSKFKGGVFQSSSERTYSEETFFITANPRVNIGPVSPTVFAVNYMDPSFLGYTRSGSVTSPRFNFQRFFDPQSGAIGNNSYDGSQLIQAAYLMTELALTERLKLIGGARLETTDLQVEATSVQLGTTTSGIQQDDVLPAVGLVYQLRTNMNLRLNYASTIARPTYREFAATRQYDVPNDEIIEGNPNLKISSIENYDIRWEWFPRPGEVISLGAFYKTITDPIERISFRPLGDIVTYTNTGEATVYGLEVELRKNLDFISPVLDYFSIGVNYAWIKSEVNNPPFVVQSKQATLGIVDETRPLFDQSPYVVNADITFNHPSWGTTFTVAFSQAGERLYVVNNANYDVYEQPTPQLDVLLSQRLSPHWRIRISAKNLLNPDYERIYGTSEDNLGALPYSSYTKGMKFGFSITYDF